MKKNILTATFAFLFALPVFSQVKQETPVQILNDKNKQQDNGLLLISPENGRRFEKEDALKPITFRAQPQIAIRPGVKYNFKVTVWQLQQGQTAVQAARSNQPIVVKEVANMNQATIANIFTGPCKPPYLCDFVWMAEISRANEKEPLKSDFSIFSMAYKNEKDTVKPTVKYLDHQVWDYLGPQVVCERQGVIFQAAKKIGVNLFSLFAEFTDITYYESSAFVNNLPSPLPYPIISIEHITIPIGDTRVFCNKLGIPNTSLLGIYEIKETNSRTNGGSVDLGSISPVDFEFFTLANLWNSYQPDNLDNACRDCEQPEIMEWWGNEPFELEIEINTEHENPGNEEFNKPVVIDNNGKISRIIIKNKRQADELKKIGMAVSKEKPAKYIKCVCGKNIWAKDKASEIKICDYLKTLLLKNEIIKR